MRNANVGHVGSVGGQVATMAGRRRPPLTIIPIVVQGRGVGIPGDCSYQTYEQCMASASGRGVYCNVNPRAALNQQPRRRCGSIGITDRQPPSPEADKA